MSARAASLVARGAEQQLDAAQLLAIERWAPERVLLAAAEQMPRDHDELACGRDGRDLAPRRAAMRSWKARSGPGVRGVCIEGVGHDALNDPPDRAPADPQQPGDWRLRHLLGQPGH